MLGEYFRAYTITQRRRAKLFAPNETSNTFAHPQFPKIKHFGLFIIEGVGVVGGVGRVVAG